MKVNFIIPFTSLTGGIRVAFLYGNYLVSKGNDVTFYFPFIPYKFKRTFIELLRSAMGNFYKKNNVKWFENNFKIKMVPLIRNQYIDNADIIIATAWPTAYDVYNLDQNKGKKIYLIQDYEIWSGKKEDVDLSYKLPMYRIVITNKLNKLLLDKFNVKSKVIYNGLNDGEFIANKSDIENRKIKVILMQYNEAANKGIRKGIEILETIEKKIKIKIILFGYKKGKFIPNNFEFYESPSRKILMDLYRKSDIYLFPSEYESWGLPVMECMANKCAVVGNNTGCLEEIGIDNENAIIVDGFDKKIVEERLEKLINDDDLLNKIKENAYKLAKKFKWSNSYISFENCIDQLIETDKKFI